MGEFVCVYACVSDRLIVCRFSGIRSCYGNPTTMSWAVLYFTPERERRKRRKENEWNRGLKRAIMKKYLWCRCERKSSSIPAEWAEICCLCDYIYMHLYMWVYICMPLHRYVHVWMCLFVLYIGVHIGLVHFMLGVNFYIYIFSSRALFSKIELNYMHVHNVYIA